MNTIFLPALAQVSGKVEAISSDGNEITVAGKRIRFEEARGLRDPHSGRRPPAASRVDCE